MLPLAAGLGGARQRGGGGQVRQVGRGEALGGVRNRVVRVWAAVRTGLAGDGGGRTPTRC